MWYKCNTNEYILQWATRNGIRNVCGFRKRASFMQIFYILIIFVVVVVVVNEWTKKNVEMSILVLWSCCE